MKIPFIALAGVAGLFLAFNVYTGNATTIDNSSKAISLVEEITKEEETENVEELVEIVPDFSPIYEILEKEEENEKEILSFEKKNGEIINYSVMGKFYNPYGTVDVIDHADQEMLNQLDNIQLWYDNGTVASFEGHNNADLTSFGVLNLFTKKDYFENQILEFEFDGKKVNLQPVLCVQGKKDDSLASVKTIEDIKNFSNDKNIVQGNIENLKEERMFCLITCLGKSPAVNRTYLFCTIQ